MVARLCEGDGIGVAGARAVAFGATPLILAAENGSDAVVNVLLAHGASPHVTLPSGDTPLMVAVAERS